MSIENKQPLFTNPLETAQGLSIDDLNKYLPALHKIEDLIMTADKMKDGIFLGTALDGIRKIPDNTIDLIIANPPEKPQLNPFERGSRMTIKEYFEWNENWIKEGQRVLKPTGAIYLICGWKFSGMYHSIINNNFQLQTRISWRDINSKDKSNQITWKNEISDIWFATKTNEFMFNQEIANNINLKQQFDPTTTNLWNDIIDFKNIEHSKIEEDKPAQLIERILSASSFKLNWILDPFTRSGGIGVASKKMGRRFIGFESNKDKLLMAMKRIDKE